MSTEIRFYRATGEWGFLSNLYPSPIVLSGQTWPDVERYYQAGKAVDPSVSAWLLAAPTATLCAQAAHALLPWQVVPGWTEKKVERMRTGLLAKFQQHQDLAAKLVATGIASLIEESKTDGFWGLGRNGKGKNMLGVLLMDLRQQLLQSGVTP